MRAVETSEAARWGERAAGSGERADQVGDWGGSVERRVVEDGGVRDGFVAAFGEEQRGEGCEEQRGGVVVIQPGLAPAEGEGGGEERGVEAGESAVDFEVRRQDENADRNGERTAEEEHEPTPPRQRPQQARESGEDGDVPEEMRAIEVHEVAGEETPEFAASDGGAVELEDVGHMRREIERQREGGDGNGDEGGGVCAGIRPAGSRR